MNKCLFLRVCGRVELLFFIYRGKYVFNLVMVMGFLWIFIFCRVRIIIGMLKEYVYGVFWCFNL